MIDTVDHGQRAQTKPRAARNQGKARRRRSRSDRIKRALVECAQRLAFSPFEFGHVGGENNAIVVTARGQPFEQGILLDSWRAQPHVTWTQVTKDPGYHWNENKSFAALVLRKSK